MKKKFSIPFPSVIFCTVCAKQMDVSSSGEAVWLKCPINRNHNIRIPQTNETWFGDLPVFEIEVEDS